MLDELLEDRKRQGRDVRPGQGRVHDVERVPEGAAAYAVRPAPSGEPGVPPQVAAETWGDIAFMFSSRARTSAWRVATAGSD